MSTHDIIGTFGVSIPLLAYFLNAFGYLTPKDRSYLCMNILGAFIAGSASYMIAFYPFVVLEGVWFLVSLSALIQTFRSQPKENNRG